MKTVNKRTIEDLLEHDSDCCISLYLPTHRNGKEVQDRSDRIHLKNVLKSARMQLEQTMSSEEAISILAPAAALLDEDAFWTELLEGLAIFLNREGYIKTVRLPFSVEEKAHVDRYYLFTPLARAIDLRFDFFLLAINRGNVALYKGDYLEMQEIDISDRVPLSMREYLRYDDGERQLQYHSLREASQQAVFHGHGGEKEVSDSQLRRFINEVAKGFQSFFSRQETPLILAGDKEAIAMMKLQFHYPHLVDKHIFGNMELMPVKELWNRALEILQPVTNVHLEERLADFEKLAGTGQTATSDREIIPAAFYKQVATLFINEKHQAWGSFNKQTNTLKLKPVLENGEHDMVNAAVGMTLKAGGDVFVLEQEKMPTAQGMAAILRY